MRVSFLARVPFAHKVDAHKDRQEVGLPLLGVPLILSSMLDVETHLDRPGNGNSYECSPTSSQLQSKFALLQSKPGLILVDFSFQSLSKALVLSFSRRSFLMYRSEIEVKSNHIPEYRNRNSEFNYSEGRTGATPCTTALMQGYANCFAT